MWNLASRKPKLNYYILLYSLSSIQIIQENFLNADVMFNIIKKACLLSDEYYVLSQY